MRRYYKKGSVIIDKVGNGYMVNIEGTKEEQEDNIGTTHVFETNESLCKWLCSYYGVVGNE